MSINGFIKAGLILWALSMNPSVSKGLTPDQETLLENVQSVSEPRKTPRLAVLIIIDQFRHDYLARFEDLFVADGFRRLMDHGAWMQDARFSHVHASTSPGHSVVTVSYTHLTLPTSDLV